VAIFCTSYSSLVGDLILSPILVIYYAYDAYNRADWVGPTGIFGLFLISVIINRLLMTPVVQSTVRHEKSEGYFRFAHATIRSSSESLAFCGTKAAIFEQVHQADPKLKNVCQAQFDVFKAQFWLELSTNGSSYLGSIASFLIISMPIFAGDYDGLTQPELSKVISENSFVCMYLAYQLSTLVSMSVLVSQLLGVSFRVSEMVRELKSLPSTYSTLSGTEAIYIGNNNVKKTLSTAAM
jgi:ATP-binding cassette subfamily D (ALD) protein 4